MQVCSKANVPMRYVPIFADAYHQEWFEAFWLAELGAMFQKGELAVQNIERLDNYTHCHYSRAMVLDS